MSVEGDDQVTGGQYRPDPEVDPVVPPPDHPAQEEVVALAGRAPEGIGEEKGPLPGKGRSPGVPEPPEKPGKTLPRPGVFRALQVQGLQASVLEVRRSQAGKKASNPGGGHEPVAQTGDARPRNGARSCQSGVRRRPQSREQPFEKRPDLGDVPEGERGRGECGRLDVFPGPEAVGELDGVGGKRYPAIGGDRIDERFPKRRGGCYGITLFNGYSTIPDAPDFFSTGMSSRTVLSSTITSRLNHPASLSDDIVGF